LIIMVCPTTGSGQHYAQELARDQTLENLKLFSDRLAKAHKILAKHGGCTCKKK